MNVETGSRVGGSASGCRLVLSIVCLVWLVAAVSSTTSCLLGQKRRLLRLRSGALSNLPLDHSRKLPFGKRKHFAAPSPPDESVVVVFIGFRRRGDSTTLTTSGDPFFYCRCHGNGAPCISCRPLPRRPEQSSHMFSLFLFSFYFLQLDFPFS